MNRALYRDLNDETLRCVHSLGSDLHTIGVRQGRLFSLSHCDVVNINTLVLPTYLLFHIRIDVKSIRLPIHCITLLSITMLNIAEHLCPR